MAPINPHKGLACFSFMIFQGSATALAVCVRIMPSAKTTWIHQIALAFPPTFRITGATTAKVKYFSVLHGVLTFYHVRCLLLPFTIKSCYFRGDSCRLWRPNWSCNCNSVFRQSRLPWGLQKSYFHSVNEMKLTDISTHSFCTTWKLSSGLWEETPERMFS